MIRNIQSIFNKHFRLEMAVIMMIFFIVSRQDAEEQYQRAEEILKVVQEYITTLENK